MTNQQYLEQVLAKYNLSSAQEQSLKNKRMRVEEFLQKRYPSKIRSFYYSGSYAKDTAINLKYDLDLCIYFKHNAFQTLAEMYNSVYENLKSMDQVNKQRVSIRMPSGKESIDVVPARCIDDTSDYANLYVTTGSQIQTNIKKHKEYISQSGCRPIIKLMKVWKIEHGIHYKSFALELLTIRALDGFKDPDYGERFVHVLRFIRDNVENVRLIDPANQSNNVADLISVNDKLNMKNQAAASLQQTWEQVIS